MVRTKKKQAPVEEPLPLRLEYRSPAELEDNPSNWRRHPEAQTAALADIIGEVGWAGACLLNERTGRLIDGHARKKIALARNEQKIPVLVGSWDEATEKKILLTLDPLGAMAQADAQALDSLLREVQTGSEAVGRMLTELAQNAAVIPTKLAPTDPANDPVAEWQGMPEFEHEDQTSKFRAIVHFATEEDRRAFEALVGQKIPENTRAIWHPKQEMQKTRDKRYASDEP